MTMQHREDADFPSTVMAETVSDCDMVNVASNRDSISSGSEHSSTSPILSDADHSLHSSSLGEIEPLSGVANLADSAESVACIDDAKRISSEITKATENIELVRSRGTEKTVESASMKEGVNDTQSGSLSAGSNTQNLVTVSSHFLNTPMGSSEAILNISSSKQIQALGITDALQSKSALSVADLSKKVLAVTQELVTQSPVIQAHVTQSSVNLNAAQAVEDMLPQESVHSVQNTQTSQSTPSQLVVKDESSLVNTIEKQGGASTSHQVEVQEMSCAAHQVYGKGGAAVHQLGVQGDFAAVNEFAVNESVVNGATPNVSQLNVAAHDVLTDNKNLGTESTLSKTLGSHTFKSSEGTESTNNANSLNNTECAAEVESAEILCDMDAAVEYGIATNLDATGSAIAPRTNINEDEQFSAIKCESTVKDETAINNESPIKDEGSIKGEAVVIENGVATAMSEINAASYGTDIENMRESQMVDGSETLSVDDAKSLYVDDTKSVDDTNLQLSNSESIALANSESIALANGESIALANTETTALSSSGTVSVGHASEIAPFPIYSQPYTQPQELNTVIEETDSFGVSKHVVNDNSKCGHMPCFFIFDYAADRFLLDAGSCRLLGLTYTGEWIPSHFIEKQMTIIEDERYFNVLFTQDYGDLLLQTVRVNHGEHEGDLIYMSGSVLQRDDTGIALVVAGYLSRIQVNFVEYLSRIKNNSSAFDFDVVTGEIHYGPAYKDLLGYKDSKEIPSYLSSFEKTLIHPDDLPIFKRINDIIENPQGGYYYEAIFRLQHKSGFYLWCISRGLIVERDGSGRATRIIGTTTNIDILRSNFERLKRSIYQDPLTGLHNRLYLNTRYKYFTMEESQPLSLVYADISGLKLINDYLGHSNGDTLVKLAAQILQNDIYLDHEVVRLSGDEFLLIFTACPAVECRLFINKFTVELNERNKYQEFPVPIFFGFGIATLYEIGHDDTFLRCEARADARLQEYKKAHHDYIYSALRAFLETTLGQNIDLTDNRRLDYLDHDAPQEQQNQLGQYNQQGLNSQQGQQGLNSQSNEHNQQGLNSQQNSNSLQGQTVGSSGYKQAEQNQNLGDIQQVVKHPNTENQNVSAGQDAQSSKVYGAARQMGASQSGQLEHSAQFNPAASSQSQASLGQTLYGRAQQNFGLNTANAMHSTAALHTVTSSTLHTVTSLYGTTDEDAWDVSGQSTTNARDTTDAKDTADANAKNSCAQVSSYAQSETLSSEGHIQLDAQAQVDNNSQTDKQSQAVTCTLSTALDTTALSSADLAGTQIPTDFLNSISSTANVESNESYCSAINAALNITLDTDLNNSLSDESPHEDNASRYMSYLDDCLARLQAGSEGANYSGYVARKPVYHSIHRSAVCPSTVQSNVLQEGYNSEQRVATSQVEGDVASYTVVSSADLVTTSYATAQSETTQAVVVEPRESAKGELGSLDLNHADNNADAINANANTYECSLAESTVTTPSTSGELTALNSSSTTGELTANSSSTTSDITSIPYGVITDSSSATSSGNSTKSQVEVTSNIENSTSGEVLKEYVAEAAYLASRNDLYVAQSRDGIKAADHCISHSTSQSTMGDNSSDNGNAKAICNTDAKVCDNANVLCDTDAKVFCDTNAVEVLPESQTGGKQSNQGGLKEIVVAQQGSDRSLLNSKENSLQSGNLSSLTSQEESEQAQHAVVEQNNTGVIKQDVHTEQVEPLHVSESLVSEEAGLDNLSYVDALSYPHHDVYGGSHLSHILQMLQHGETLSPDEDIPVKSSDFSNNQKPQWAKSWLELINDGHEALQVPEVSVSDLKPEVIAAAEHAVFLEDEYARRAIDNLPEDLTPNTTIRPIDEDEVQSAQSITDQSLGNGQDQELYTKTCADTEITDANKHNDDATCAVSGKQGDASGNTQPINAHDISYQAGINKESQQSDISETTLQTSTTKVVDSVESCEHLAQGASAATVAKSNGIAHIVNADSALTSAKANAESGASTQHAEQSGAIASVEIAYAAHKDTTYTTNGITDSANCSTDSANDKVDAASGKSSDATNTVSYEQVQVEEQDSSQRNTLDSGSEHISTKIAPQYKSQSESHTESQSKSNTEPQSENHTEHKTDVRDGAQNDIRDGAQGDVRDSAQNDVRYGVQSKPNLSASGDTDVTKNADVHAYSGEATVQKDENNKLYSSENGLEQPAKTADSLLTPSDSSQGEQEGLKANYAIEVGAKHRQTTSALVMINQHNVERELSRQVSDSMETDLTSSGAAFIKEHQEALRASEDAMLRQHAYIGQFKPTICSDEAQPSASSSVTDIGATGRTISQSYAGFGMCGALGAAEGVYASLDSPLERRAETANVISYENKALDQELLGSIAAAFSSNGISDVHDNLSNESVEASSQVDASQLVLGYWYYRGKDQSFLLDKQCADYYGLPYSNEWIHEDVMLQCIESLDKERYYKVMHSLDMGSIIFENIMLKNPRWKNKHFVIDGSVLSRFPDSSVRYAVGYLTQVESSFSELIAHEIAGDGFFTWDQESGCLHFSSSTPHVQGRGQNEFNCSFYEWLRDMVHPDDIEILDVERNIFVSANYGDNFEFCIRLRQLKGNYIWSIARGIVLKRNEVGQATSVIGTLSNINLIRDNFENIKQLLYTDTLTGLHNRSYFQHHMTLWQDEMLQPVSVIYADITGLKITNDVLGHADGDALIMAVTDALTMVLDSSCDIMRLSGDEFLVVMPHCDKELSLQRIDELQDYLKERNKQPGVMPVFIGFGRATMGEVPQDTLHACIERADVRMQKVKEEKRSENYKALQKYLEMRKGRPVSMRDGRRLEYYSDEERKQANIRNASGKPAAITKTPY